MSEILVVVICLALNAILAAVEMAFVTVTRPRLREQARKGNKDAKRILMLRENPERTLSVIQVGLTLSGAVAAAVGGVGAAESMGPWIASLYGLDVDTGKIIALVAVVLPLTYLNVVIGELVPKALALRHPMFILKWTAKPLMASEKIFSPVVTMLERSTRSILRLLRIGSKPASVSSEASDEDSSSELGKLSHQTRRYVLNLVDLEHKTIEDVGIEWDQVLSINSDDPPELVEAKVLESGHTRLPVIDRLSGEVLGLLNTKEFMLWRATGETDWARLVRPAIRISKNLPILHALSRMQDRNSRLCVFYDEGELAGIVTVEDIFEEIIGDLFDEDDDETVKRILAARAKMRRYNRPVGGQAPVRVPYEDRVH